MRYEAFGRFTTCAIAIALWVGVVPTFGAGTDYHNVVIVLDASGSMDLPMKGTNIKKMDTAKAALKDVLRYVPEDTQIGLLVFSSDPARSGWLYPLGTRNDAALMKAIDLPGPGGYTPLGKYIKLGADRLIEKRKKQLGYGTYRLLIVTDGEANDQDLVEKYTPEVIARGITMDVIGVDMSMTHTLATRAHSYRKADDAETLKKAIAEVFSEVSDRGTDATPQEAFDMLAGISDDTASAMLKALSVSGNQPIGLQAEATQKAPSAQPVPAKPASSQTEKRKAPPGESLDWQIVYYLIAAIVVLFFIFQRRRKRRG